MLTNRVFGLASLALAAAGVAFGADPIFYGYLNAGAIDLNADYSKYNHIAVIFAIIKEDGTFAYNDDAKIPELANKAHESGGKVLAALGGYAGSNNFSSIVRDENLRNQFAQHISDYIKEKNLDGVDLDWVYVGVDLTGCAVTDPANDSKNYLTFLQGLRKKLDDDFGPRNKLITLGVRVLPFEGPDGPVDDVSEFAKVVDFANLFQFDLNGPWGNTTGPLAPLNFQEGKGEQVSYTSAIDAWINAKWPANQLTASIPMYGLAFQAAEDMLADPGNQYQATTQDIPVGDSDDGPETGPCGGKESASGQWKWKNLIGQGVMSNPTTPNEPWSRQVDEQTKTPWLFNKDNKIFISMDDPDSIKAKVDFAKEKGLAGMNAYTIDMDTGGQELTNAIVNDWNS
ncbi:hypothetical protein XA68_14980 [Ophiocordyceps unilateralis]|uniref:chitinase n=1 Tax=Ophiocordyceps unilateralis TaxID=268505 RepID=A0A2A9PM66_OPHUN|nr:hypothetical protein XA68_14980 [Ophiocordyceps unilateralis]